MQRITLRLLIGGCTFALGVALAGVWAFREFDCRNGIRLCKRVTATKVEVDVQSGWQKVDMEGKATFYIPSDLRPIVRDAPRPYRDFGNDRMEFFIYRRSSGSPTCEEDAKVADKARVTRTSIGGKPAIVEDIGDTTFHIEQNEPVLKGVMICVSNVGDDEFLIVGKYKSDGEYQILQTIIESITFP